MLYYGGSERVYELPEDEQETVPARILTPDAEGGWGNTHPPASTVDQVHLNSAVAKATKKGAKKSTGSADLDSFNSWAGRES